MDAIPIHEKAIVINKNINHQENSPKLAQTINDFSRKKSFC